MNTRQQAHAFFQKILMGQAINSTIEMHTGQKYILKSILGASLNWSNLENSSLANLETDKGMVQIDMYQIKSIIP